jgi:hypothetical protein
MAGDEDDEVVLRLTAPEAMTVLAAVRQYEPYWPAGETPEAVGTRLGTVRSEVESVIAKIRSAAARR